MVKGLKMKKNMTSATDVDARRGSDPAFEAGVAVSRDERLLIGGLKNLLSGVTTVAHHDPFYPFLSNPHFPTRVISDYGWSHSLYVEGGEKVRDSHHATPGDWLGLVQQGQSWGFPDCYGQGGSECADAPEPVATLDKHAAVAGVAIVTGQLGSTVGNAAIVAEWATGKVQLVTLNKTGSLYTGSVATFLTGIQSPEPVILTPDGALLVGDWATETVYRIGVSS